MASGDYKGMKINDAFILVMNEFKNLSAEDKQVCDLLGNVTRRGNANAAAVEISRTGRAR